MKSSGWLILDAVEDLFIHAKSRVYDNQNELFPEPCPKWKALSEILKEVQIHMTKIDHEFETSKQVLVLTYDGRTCAQLRNYLTMGASEYLLWEAMKCLKKLEPVMSR